MALVLSSPADAVNAALVRIGYKLRVGSLYDGSTAAKKALDIYGQTRDELLNQNDWVFAERNVALTLLKSAPVQGYIPPATWDPALYPPIPWRYEYTYPSDCLKVRAIKPTPLFIPDYDPQPFVYATPNDNSYTPARRVICTMLPAALLVYTGQVTDLETFDVDFTEMLIDALGRRLAPSLASLDVMKIQAQLEANDMAVAEANQG